MMTKRKEVMDRTYWTTNREWYTFDKASGYHIKEDAPEAAQNSYREWLKHQGK